MYINPVVTTEEEVDELRRIVRRLEDRVRFLEEKVGCMYIKPPRVIRHEEDDRRRGIIEYLQEIGRQKEARYED